MASRALNFEQTTKTTFAASTLDTNDAKRAADEDAEVTNTSPEETLALQLQVQEMEVREARSSAETRSIIRKPQLTRSFQTLQTKGS